MRSHKVLKHLCPWCATYAPYLKCGRNGKGRWTEEWLAAGKTDPPRACREGECGTQNPRPHWWCRCWEYDSTSLLKTQFRSTCPTTIRWRHILLPSFAHTLNSHWPSSRRVSCTHLCISSIPKEHVSLCITDGVRSIRMNESEKCSVVSEEAMGIARMRSLFFPISFILYRLQRSDKHGQEWMRRWLCILDSQ